MADSIISQQYEAPPAALLAWLAKLGWTEEGGINSHPTDRAVLAFGPYRVVSVLGVDAGLILLSHTSALTIPGNVRVSGIGAALVGGWAAEPHLPTPIEWMDRISRETQLALYAAAQSNPALGFWLFRLGAAQVVEVGNPDTVAGVTAVFAAGLITAEDRAALLA